LEKFDGVGELSIVSETIRNPALVLPSESAQGTCSHVQPCSNKVPFHLSTSHKVLCCSTSLIEPNETLPGSRMHVSHYGELSAAASQLSDVLLQEKKKKK
jgi:hypothetical protein